MKAALFTFALMVSQLGAMAGTNEHTPPADNTVYTNSASLERSLGRQINKHITFPLLDREHNMTGEVLVSFVINTEGKMEVLSATSSNDELRAYVLRKLGKVDIGTNPSGTWRTSHMRFVFRPEA